MGLGTAFTSASRSLGGLHVGTFNQLDHDELRSSIDGKEERESLPLAVRTSTRSICKKPMDSCRTSSLFACLFPSEPNAIAFIRQPQPSTQLRILSYEWLRRWGRSCSTHCVQRTDYRLLCDAICCDEGSLGKKEGRDKAQREEYSSQIERISAWPGQQFQLH